MGVAPTSEEANPSALPVLASGATAPVPGSDPLASSVVPLSGLGTDPASGVGEVGSPPPLPPGPPRPPVPDAPATAPAVPPRPRLPSAVELAPGDSSRPHAAASEARDSRANTGPRYFMTP